MITSVNEFLSSCKTCVIATVSKDGKPQAATIGFYHDPENSYKILIGTNKSSRKYANLVSNPNVALTMGFEGPKTVQIEGTAEEVPASSVTTQLDAFFTKTPSAKKFSEVPGQTYFLITPNWLRFTDYAAEVSVQETKDFS